MGQADEVESGNEGALESPPIRSSGTERGTVVPQEDTSEEEEEELDTSAGEIRR